MWLINASTRKLEAFDDRKAENIGYAIVSHTWNEDEMTFQEWASIAQEVVPDTKDVQRKTGYKKISNACDQALRDKLNYVWIDTCCIDKSSSAELSEAINSMFRWYKSSEICYVYLDDVDLGQRGPDSVLTPLDDGTLARCRWFTRMWTLQELIGPAQAVFYDKNWTFIGTKEALARSIHKATQIDLLVLENAEFLSSVCIAKRLSWAAHREATRTEDEAYALLGICNVSMPLLYGEGKAAFPRLQQEIMRTNPDPSILLWTPSRSLLQAYRGQGSLFALSPEQFAGCGRLITCPDALNRLGHDSFELSSSGLRMRLPVLTVSGSMYAILNCRYEDDFNGLIALQVNPLDTMQTVSNSDFMLRVCRAWRPVPHALPVTTWRFPVISPQQLASASRKNLLLSAIYHDPVSPHLFNTNFWFRPMPSFQKAFSVISAEPKERWAPKTGVMYWPYSYNLQDVQGRITWMRSRRDLCVTLIFSITRTRAGSISEWVHRFTLVKSAVPPDTIESALSSNKEIRWYRFFDHQSRLGSLGRCAIKAGEKEEVVVQAKSKQVMQSHVFVFVLKLRNLESMEEIEDIRLTASSSTLASHETEKSGPPSRLETKAKL